MAEGKRFELLNLRLETTAVAERPNQPGSGILPFKQLLVSFASCNMRLCLFWFNGHIAPLSRVGDRNIQIQTGFRVHHPNFAKGDHPTRRLQVQTEGKSGEIGGGGITSSSSEVRILNFQIILNTEIYTK